MMVTSMSGVVLPSQTLVQYVVRKDQQDRKAPKEQQAQLAIQVLLGL